MLSLSQEAAYVDEPFNPGRTPGWAARPFPYWYQYICTENELDFLRVIRNAVRLRYPLVRSLARVRTKEHFDRAVGDWMNGVRARRRGMRALLKDPIAFMSAPWLAERFDARVVVLVRHPAAFAGSLKRLDWQFDFGQWLHQDLLMRDLLGPFREEIEEATRRRPDLIGQAILLWKVIYSVARRFQDDHPDWLFVRYEDLAEAPVEGFSRLYEELGLSWSDRVTELIEDHTGPRAPKDVAPDDVATIKRNSRAAMWAWRDRLTDEEIERVRDGVFDVGERYYSDADWNARGLESRAASPHPRSSPRDEAEISS